MDNIRCIFLLFFFSSFLTACVYDSQPDYSNDELDLESLEQYVEYDGLSIYIGGYLYVNDIPKAIPDNKPLDNNGLIAIISIKAVERAMPNYNISNSRLYLVQKGTVLWESPVNIKPEIRTRDSNLEVIFRGGPSTLRNQMVDTVLEFENQGEQYRVMAKSRHVSVIW